MAMKIYPQTITEPSRLDYTVKVNGVEVPLQTARVSIEPHNRRWPGHQRQIEQTDLINFANLAVDEAVEFEITPNKPFEKVVIRPLALGIEPEVKDGVIKFTLPKAAYFTVEPFGRHGALHIFADPMPKYDIDPNAEGVLYFGPGEHDVGLITLESNQTLFIDEGAVVYTRVCAKNAHNIKILGRGILDHSRHKEKILFEYVPKDNAELGKHEAIRNAVRTDPIVFEYCSDIVVEGITIRDSLHYNIRPVACKNIHISNVKIIGCWRYNSDGIDMHNCDKVRIENCFIRTFDDCICVKGFDCYDPESIQKAKENPFFRDVRIRNCVLWNDWNKCLEIGAETRAEEMYDIIFEDCNIIHVTGPVLDVHNVDFADVHDVTYRNITVEYDEEIQKPLYQETDEQKYYNKDVNYAPDLIRAVVEYHHEYSAKTEKRGINRNITFENIHLFGRQKPKCMFKGYSDVYATRDIVVRNLFWNGKAVEKLEADQWDLREHTSNIVFEGAYAQLDKNTVEAKGQLKPGSDVRFLNGQGKGKRILLVGNSMTVHGPLARVGWSGDWGMAASCEEKDYVHQLLKMTAHKDAVLGICQVSSWESQYKEGGDRLQQYASAREFDADVIVMRFIENCPKDQWDGEVFQKQLDSLLTFLNKSGKANIILTTGFWRHPGDEDIRQYAKEKNLPCIEMGDLGEQDEMKAIGLFEHKGVANHPGDLGMETMAQRMYEEVKNLI